MSDPNGAESHKGIIGFVRRLWSFVSRPSGRFPLGALLIAGVVGGIAPNGTIEW